MKRTIILIAFFILLISIPMLAEANDTTEMNLPNPALKSKKVKSPWYKNIPYNCGYEGKFIYPSNYMSKSKGYTLGEIPNYWVNTIYFSIPFMLGNNESEMGLCYSFRPKLKDRTILHISVIDSISGYSTTLSTGDYWNIIWFNIFLKYYFKYAFYIGISPYVSKVSTIEYFGSISAVADRYCIGGTVFFGWERNKWVLGRVKPYLQVQLGEMKEIVNSSPFPWGNYKIKLNLHSIFIGLKIRLRSER